MSRSQNSCVLYLDYNASAPLRPSLLELQREIIATPGNASSLHAFGRRARAYVERAREQVAALVGASPEGVIFTGSGSEANALALHGRCAWVSQIEHLSVLEQPSAVPQFSVTDEGVIDVAAMERVLSRVLGRVLDIDSPQPQLLSVMAANNETGVLQPIAAITARARAFDLAVHCDATQAAGRIAIDIDGWGVESLTLSAHKLGGPQGVGALIMRSPRLASDLLTPLLRGGGQEAGLRSGTENVAAIAAFGMACEEAEQERADMASLAERRDAFERLVIERMPDVQIIGAQSPRLANTSCLIHPSSSAEVQIMRLDLSGIAVSSGSACSSGKITPSHVLAAMGLPHDACRRAIRVSIGKDTRLEDLQRMLETWCLA